MHCTRSVSGGVVQAQGKGGAGGLMGKAAKWDRLDGPNSIPLLGPDPPTWGNMTLRSDYCWRMST